MLSSSTDHRTIMSEWGKEAELLRGRWLDVNFSNTHKEWEKGERERCADSRTSVKSNRQEYALSLRCPVCTSAWRHINNDTAHGNMAAHVANVEKCSSCRCVRCLGIEPWPFLIAVTSQKSGLWLWGFKTGEYLLSHTSISETCKSFKIITKDRLYTTPAESKFTVSQLLILLLYVPNMLVSGSWYSVNLLNQFNQITFKNQLALIHDGPYQYWSTTKA